MLIHKNKQHSTGLFFIVFTISILSVAGQETYDELCQECKAYNESYRLSGWVCWTICGSQDTSKLEKNKQINNPTKVSTRNSKEQISTKNLEQNDSDSSGPGLSSYWLNDRYRQFLLEPSRLIEVFKKARCIFPKDLDSITRALLLQQCLSRNQAQGNETVCYEELGCFPMEKPWVSLLRPFPTPHTPDQIDVKLYLYTRQQSERFTVPLWPQISLEGSDYNPERNRTVFITHGFASNGNTTWMDNLKDGYLTNEDANVFLVDWGKGASLFNYLQVASNTRIVGAELARFGKYLLKNGLDPKSLHLIGHSLGSHISSYMAKNIVEMGKPGRITALDPAQPGFEIESESVRLVKDDAAFVDVLHTDAKPFIPFVGFGLLFPAGHVDFYINGGTNQPGCLTNINIGKIKTIYDLADIPVEVVSQWVSCSHGRSYEVFIASLISKGECLWAIKIPYFANLLKVTTMGALRLFDPLIENVESCTQESCTILGLPTPYLRARGIFSLSTTRKSPYCITDEERDRKIRNVLTLGLSNLSGLQTVGSKIRDGLLSLFNF